MFQACRPAGRLFYLVLAVMVAASIPGLAREEVSAGNPGKPTSSPATKPPVAEALPRAASPFPQSGPTLTSVIDTVYLADGADAQGILVITWPAFVTASGTAVAAGVLDVTLGANGALNVALESNAAATPSGVYYTVVYQLEAAVAAREIIDPVKFKDGISMIIDGTVACLNASTWTKSGAQPPSSSPRA